MANYNADFSTDYNRGVTSQQVASNPAFFDVLDVAGEFTGNWTCIEVYNADFQDNLTDVVLGLGDQAETKNLFLMNALIPNGKRIEGNFTKLVIPVGSTMKILAYRFG